MGGGVKNEKKRFSSTFKHQFRQQFTYKHKDMQNISIDDLDEISTKNLLDKPKELEQNPIQTDNISSYYRISIWRLHSGKLSLMECKLDLQSSESFYFFRDQLFFSHDGHYIFALLANGDGQIIKALIMKSDDLSLPECHELDLSSYNILSQEITGEPSLIWGHKDSFNVEYARRSERMTELGSFTQSYFLQINQAGYAKFFSLYQMELSIQLDNKRLQDKDEYRILGMLFQENDQNSFERNFYQRGIFIFVKFPQQECANCVHILKTSFDRLRAKLNRSSTLTFTDEVDQVCILKHEELRGVWNDVKIIASHDLQNILIVSSIEETENNQANQYNCQDNNFNNAFFLAKPATFDQLDYLEDNTNITNQTNLCGSIEDTQKHRKEVIPFVFRSSAPIQTNKFSHVQKNIYVSIFNDYLQQDVIINSIDVMSELQKPQNQHQHVHLDQVTSYKIEGQIEFNYMNCFDVLKDDHARILTLGLEFSSQLIQKLTIGVYDDTSYQKYILEQQEYLFINPFIIYVNSNNQMLLTSILKDSNKTYCFQLKEQIYLQSIEICGQTFYRHESCVFLTLSETNKVLLNIVKIPVYDLYQHNDIMHQPKFYFQKLKIQYAIDLRYLQKEKILKAIIGNILVKDTKKQLTIVIQYEKEVLIRSFNAMTFQDSFQTNSLIPMIAQEGQFDINDKDNSMYVFIHSKLDNTQNINLLALYEQDPPKFTSICEFKGQQIIAMARYQRMFMTLDDTLSAKLFNYSTECKQLVLFNEEEILEEAGYFVKYYQQNAFSQQKMPQCIALSNTEAYIGPTFFHYTGFTKNYQDGLSDFEQTRNKYIHDLSFDNLVKGPIPSLDNNYLMYVCVDTDQVMNEDIRKTDIRESERRNMFKHQKFYSQQEVMTNDSEKGKGSSPKKSELQRKTSSNMFQSLRSPRGGQLTSKSVKQIADRYDPLEVINSVDSNIIEKQESSKIRIKQRIFCIPYIGSKQVPILHKDKYLVQNIQFSTFTMQSDIFLMIAGKCLMFDKNGQPIHINVDDDDMKLLQDPSVTLKRINNGQVVEAGQTFLFEGKCSYYTYHLMFKGAKTYKFEKKYEYSKCISQLSDTLDDNVEDSMFSYKDGKQDSKGNLYQVMTEYANNNLEILIYFNGQPCVDMQEYFSEKVNKDAQEFIAQLPPQMAQSFQSNDKQNEYSAIASEKKDDLSSKLKEFQEDFKSQFDFEITHNRYFILKVGKSIYYYNMLSYSKPNEVRKIKLNLRQGFIKQILQTQKFNLIQFVFIQICPFKVTFIITWDLEKNMEEQILEIPSKDTKPLSINVYKGVAERLNYYVPTKEQGFYDLRYNFAFNFFKGSDACINDSLKTINKNSRRKNQALTQSTRITTKQKLQFYKNELKFASCLTQMLGVSKEQFGMMYTSYSFVDILYLDHLSKKICIKVSKEDDNCKIEALILRHCKLRLCGGKNIMHLFCTNHKFLKRYFDEIKFLVEELNYKEGDRHIFYLLYPDDKGDTPFDIAMRENANKCIETMLDMLSYNPNYNYSKYLQKHIYELLNMQSDSVRNYLNSCTFEIKQFVKVKWGFKRDRILLSHNSSYIDDKFLSQNFGITQQDINTAHRIVELEEDQQSIHFQRQQSQQEAAYNESEAKAGFEYEVEEQNLCKGTKLNEERDYQQVIFSAVEFEWIFRGSSAQQFINNLHDNEDKQSIFKLPIIQDIIMFQWDYFFGPYLRWYFIPFICQFCCIIIFTTLAHVHQENLSGNDNIVDMIEIKADWKRIHKAFGILILIFVVYFLQIEARKLVYVRQYSFLELLFLSNQFVVVVLHFTNGSARVYTILSVGLIMHSYIMLFLRLRLFDKTAVLIHTAFYILLDIRVFSAIFFIMVLGYGNAFYVASTLQTDGNFPFPGDNFALAFFYSYSMVLGNFDVTAFTGMGSDQWVALLCLLSCTFLGSIILLNMIIAIMNDTYSGVMQIQKEERLIAKCFLIYEYDFLFSRDIKYKNTKYIIIAQLDNALNDTYDEEGKIMNVKQYLKTKLDEDQEKTSYNFKQLKGTQRLLQTQIKAQENKLCDVQDALVKIMDQLQKIESHQRTKKIIKKQKDLFKNVFIQKLQQSTNLSQKGTIKSSKEERKSKGFSRLMKQNMRPKQQVFSSLLRKTNESD